MKKFASEDIWAIVGVAAAFAILLLMARSCGKQERAEREEIISEAAYVISTGIESQTDIIKGNADSIMTELFGDNPDMDYVMEKLIEIEEAAGTIDEISDNISFDMSNAFLE